MSLTHSRVIYTTIYAVVSSVDYHGPASGFSILRVTGEGLDREVKLFGRIKPVAVGDRLEAFGMWHEVEGERGFNAFEIKKVQEVACL
ncbi:hypothetical protein [Geomesophilobacter sediminis]|uniref:Uncharacterized protein n=1 Tax=Geomesophilobacter sediminis TaxID=2798584 RepID=A0A8J7IZL6_9BACT|nr:hypothetical protein [Geomesophilobacter sediminis]MBJ6723568.1 hypothetical protein [Geomesophilobacter sediminis]